MVQRRAVRFVVFIFLDIHQSQECWMANAQTYVTIAMMYKILNNHVFVDHDLKFNTVKPTHLS